MATTNTPRLTKIQAAIVSAHTGVMIGEFADMWDYAENLLGRPLRFEEFASEEVEAAIRDRSGPDFLAISPAGGPGCEGNT